MQNELALFAGGGGGLLGSKLLGWRTLCYVENNPYCIEVIKARIKDGMLDDAPIWDDVRTFDGKPWTGSVDIVTAGFPCQPWSIAGKRQGENDDRNLWPDTIRIIREVKPDWCLLENVPGILSRSYIRRIFADLAESGFDSRWDCIPAAFVGAPHIRSRLWIVAHAAGRRERRLQLQSGGSCQKEHDLERSSEIVANTTTEYRKINRQKASITGWSSGIISDPEYDKISYNQQQKKVDIDFDRIDWWKIEPELGRVANGVANRVDRLRTIGNGQVPAVVEVAWEMLGGVK